MSRSSVLIFQILLLSICLPPPITGQNFLGKVENLSVEQGLSSRFINDLLFDQEGFLWIATDYGLNRYDGYEFTWLTSQTMGWRSDIVWMLAEDADRRLWIGTKDRTGFTNVKLQDIYIYDPETRRSVTWEEAFPAAPVRPIDIFRFVPEKGSIYLSTFGGQLYRYAGGRFTLLFEDKNLTLGEIYPTGLGSVVVKTFNPTSEREGWYIEVNDQGKLLCRQALNTFWQFLKADTDGTRWILNADRGLRSLPGLVYSFRGCGDSLRHRDWRDLNLPLDLSRHRRAHFYYDPALEAFWFADPEKIFAFSPERGWIHDFTPSFEKPFQYTGTSATRFGPGEEAWIAVRNAGQGLFHLSLRPRLFRNFLPGHANRGMLEEGDGTMLVITQSGLRHLDLTSGNWQGKVEKIGSICLLRDRRGRLWCGDMDICDPALSTMAKQVRSTIGPVWAIHESAASGRIWLGGSEGLAWVDPANDSIHAFAGYGAFLDLKKSRILWFFEERPGIIWLAASSGLYLLEEGKGIVAEYNKQATGAFFLPLGFVNHLFKDDDGIFWIATRGDGLVRWDKKNGQFQSFKMEQGLSHNIIYAVYQDRHNGLWMSSDRGIMRFDKQTHQARIFLEQDGVPHEEFNTASHYRSKDGRLWFGGLNGVAMVDPEDFYRRDQAQNKPLHISQFQQFDAAQNAFVDRTADLKRSRRIVLNPGDKFFVLKVSPLTFEPTSTGQFAWKIDDIDQDWNYQQSNTIRVNGLPAGRYRLQVKAQGGSGRWTDPLLLELRVEKPFYQQLWFYLLILALAAALIWWRFRSIRTAKTTLERIVAVRTQQIESDKKTIERQAAELQEIDHLKSRFFANISHELRTPLTLILGPIEKLLQSADTDPAESKRFLSLIQRNARSLLIMVEELLDLSKLDAKKLELTEHPVALKPLLQRIAAAFESKAALQQIHYAVQFEANPEMGVLLDVVKFERIVTNLLSNAFKHTPAGGKIFLRLQEEAEEQTNRPVLVVRVSDTGRGIHPEDLPHIFERFFQTKRTDLPLEGGSGIGLSLCREYAQLFGGTLTAESEPGKGSSFTLVIPKKEVEPGILPARVDVGEYPGTTPKSAGAFAGSNDAPPNAPLLLLVEDHPDMQAFLVEILRPFARVVTAGNGLEALNLLRDGDTSGGSPSRPLLPDLIVSDVMMPEMDGFTLLERLRREDAWRSIPLILLTARAGKEDRLHALRFGVDDYLIKPFDIEELQARVRNSLERLERRRGTAVVAIEFQPLASVDDQWLNELEKKSLAALEQQLLSVTNLAEEMGLSERQFRRKLQQLTGLSPNDFLREVRLQKARHLLENKARATVAEVCYAVGLSKPDYFSRLFVQRFGKSPSAFLR